MKENENVQVENVQAKNRTINRTKTETGNKRTYTRKTAVKAPDYKPDIVAGDHPDDIMPVNADDQHKTAGNSPDNVQAVADPVKTRGKRGKDKQPRKKRTDKNVITEPGENTKFILHDLKLHNLPKIDINNPSQVENRIQEYFSVCAADDIKPSVASLALAFNVSRFNLFDMLNGKNSVIKNMESLHTIKAAYDIINSYYEHMMNNGKINPVAGIFLMKNNMGYKDTTDYIITANQDNTINLTDIEQRAGLLTE